MSFPVFSLIVQKLLVTFPLLALANVEFSDENSWLQTTGQPWSSEIPSSKKAKDFPFALPPTLPTLPTLSSLDWLKIMDNCRKGAEKVDSTVRIDENGNAVKVVMQIVIMPRKEPWHFLPLLNVGASKDDTAWAGSADLAKAKAWTALAFSSNQNALTSRAVGQLAEDKSQPFWNIENSNQPAADDPTDPRGIQLQPGGIPLYNQQKQLIGAIGVSGDGTEQDEAVALACSSGFEAPQNIRGGNPYVDVTNPLSLLSA